MSEFNNNMKDLFKGCLTIPNLLSVIRILLIPVFAVLFLKDYVIAAVIVIIFAELTDLFDGKIARKFNQVSALGKLLDPIADKLSQMAIVIVLIVKYWDNAIKYLFMFFILKEILMIIGGAILYMPIYYSFFLVNFIARLLLSLSYMFLLDYTMSKNTFLSCFRKY